MQEHETRSIEHRTVSHEEHGMRLDRWFRLHLPQVNFAYLSKLTRTGQVRVGGARARPNTRLEEGQDIRVPPLSFDKRTTDAAAPETQLLNKADRALLQRMILHEDKDAQRAVTYYNVIDKAPPVLSWVTLKPVTGRQHQLRAHMAYIGTPIAGDEKYQGDKDLPAAIAKKLHLHARRIVFPHPRGG